MSDNKRTKSQAPGTPAASGGDTPPPGLASIKVDAGIGIALKDAPAPMGRGGGMRSPLAVQGVQNSPKPAPPKIAEKVGEGIKPAFGNPQATRNVSKIQGIDESLFSNGPTNLNYTGIDKLHGRSRRWFKLLIAGLLATGGGWLVMHPRETQDFSDFIVDAKDELIARARHQKRKKPVQSRGHDVKSTIEDAPLAEPDENVAQAPAVRRTCRDLMNASTGSGTALALAERVDLAECYLAHDDPANAESALRPLAVRLARMSEADINSEKSERTFADGLHTLIFTMIKEGKSREATDLVKGRCQRWAQSNTCVAKVMVLADHKLAASDSDSGLRSMFDTQGTLDHKAQARLWLAGAQLALTAGRPGTADQRYALALGAAPKDALVLRKQIYEMQAVDLYDRGDWTKLKATLTRSLADLKGLDAGARTKLKMLYDLSTATNKAKILRAMLSREDVTYRARGDFDLIEILGPESLRAGVEDDYIRLLRRTRDYYASTYRSLGSVAKRLIIWEARARLSQHDTDQALVLINSYEKSYSPDMLSHHLRGVTYSLMGADDRYAPLAAQEFREALKVRRDWEPLYGLGVSLLHAGKEDMVAPVIKDLEKQITTKGQRYWSDMLTAEWYIAKGKYLNAQKILTTWSQAEPGRVTPRRLQLQLFTKTGKTAQAQAVQANLDDLARTSRYMVSAEGFASPLGAMAMAKRPVD